MAAGDIARTVSDVEHKPSASTDDLSPTHGLLEKAFRRLDSGGLDFSWNGNMLPWQRTAFHFQPEKNWMNDPCGPLFHKGWYHLFYQYNQKAPVWGDLTWGHAVSMDLIHWLHLPCALVPGQSYDSNGIWTGSATILPDGRIMMLYTGGDHELVQTQCLAYPADLSDPLLLIWVKDPNNPVMIPPPGIGSEDFRDPTTAWLSSNGDKWRIAIGSRINKTSVSLVYETSDFLKYELMDGYLHQVAGTSMWECVDFYPISVTEVNGLDTSVNGTSIKHVMKVSVQDDQKDYYALGSYDLIKNKWTPDDPKLDIGIGLRYDYGKFYASKTFYDQNKQRRILWGWIPESHTDAIGILKEWNGVQSIPRTIVFDKNTGNSLLQWPVEELENLRSDSFEFNEKLKPGSFLPLDLDSSSQLDIVASFEIDEEEFLHFETMDEADNGYDSLMSGGAANRGALGPFGIIVLADDMLTELTPIYFYVAKGHNGKTETHFCVDELRSSKAPDVDKKVYGSIVPVLAGEKLTIRSLVDHSIVESFAQGGRRVITSRIYPTKAIDGAARIFLFNNATHASITASVKIWKMRSADIRSFSLDDNDLIR